MEATFGKETYKYVETKGGAPSNKVSTVSTPKVLCSSPPAEDDKNCTLKEPEKSNEKAKNDRIITDLNLNPNYEGVYTDREESSEKKDGPSVTVVELENVTSPEANTPSSPIIQKESRKIVEVNENERMKFVEVNERQEVTEEPPTKKGNRIVILRKRNREYKPLDSGDDLLEIKSEERVKLLTNYTVNPKLFCEVLIIIVKFDTCKNCL